MRVPFIDLKLQYKQIEQEVMPMITRAMADGAFVGGEQVSGFETEFASFCDSSYCVGVNSGTDALRFALMAIGVVPGDEVIGVHALGQHHQRHMGAGALQDLEIAQSGLGARRIAVIDEDDLLAVMSQQFELLGGQSRSQARHHVAYSGLVQREHIGVALDDERAIPIGYLPPGQVERVQRAALAEQRCFRGVEVLGRVVRIQRSASEAHHPVGRVDDGEDDAVAKGVVEPAAFPRPRSSILYAKAQSSCAPDEAGYTSTSSGIAQPWCSTEMRT